jgi:ABC-type phosphate/phosphonate transport system substrate-binding protein
MGAARRVIVKIRSALAVFLALFFVFISRLSVAESTEAQNLAPMQASSAAAVKRVSFTPASPAFEKGNLPERIAGEQGALVFSAPPHETEAEALRIYRPIAEYLTHIIGKKIVFHYPKDWLTYQKEMQQGSYDLVFDGPHLNSWRISNLQHHTLVKLADEYAFVVVVRKEDRITNLKQLAGLRICGMTPPDFGTLAVLSQFDNPARQPLIVNTLGSTKVYESVAIEKQCNAGILPAASLKKFNESKNLLRAIYMTQPIPNQAFSAGPRISQQDQARIAAALVSPEASQAVSRLMAANGADKGLAFAGKNDYIGLDVYLKDSWGYSR